MSTRHEILENKNSMIFDPMLIKYRWKMILGIFLYYLGELGICLGNLKFYTNKLIYIGCGWVIVVGIVLLLIYTYKSCKILNWGIFKRLIISILNCFLFINILVMIFVFSKSKKLQPYTLK